MPKYEGREILTNATADACKRTAIAWLESRGYDTPALYGPGHEGPMWVLSLEAEGYWAIEISHDESVVWPDGVWVEPVASWCLGLYPV